MTTRSDVLAQIASLLADLRVGHPVRVAVDGITAAGKSTFAAELTAAVVAAGRPSVRLSTDDYHHLRERRHRQGRMSADGYYEDAYDLDAFREHVLVPLGPSGDRRYRGRHHDLETDRLLDDPPAVASPDEVVVVDGSFLQRAELAGYWDVVIWLDTSFDVALVRAMHRDAALFGGAEPTREAYEARYHAASKRYLHEVRPLGTAHFRVGNDDLDTPTLEMLRSLADSQ